MQRISKEKEIHIKQFLIQTNHLDYNSMSIQNLIKNLFHLHHNPTKIEQAQILFNYVRDEIAYALPDHFLMGKYIQASFLVDYGKGNCVQKSLILASLARAAKIPSRLHFVDIINHLAPPSYTNLYGNYLAWHCYTELYLHGEWIVANPDYPRSLCEKKNYPLVVFDGYTDAFLPSTDNEGNLFIEYVKDHGWFSDLPRRKMQWNYLKAYFPSFIKSKFQSKKR